MGRPPTPPSSSTTMATRRTAAKSKSAQPRISSFFGKASASTVNAQPTKRSNESILKFFQKVEAPANCERSLFVGEDASENSTSHTIDLESLFIPDDELRYNENGYSQKRRRVQSSKEADLQDGANLSKIYTSITIPERSGKSEKQQNSSLGTPNTAVASKGPFADDSESEDEEYPKSRHPLDLSLKPGEGEVEIEDVEEYPGQPIEAVKPSLKRDSTSFLGDEGFEGFEDFEDDDEFYQQGEEYLERQYMEEQAAFEQDFEDDDDGGPRELAVTSETTLSPDASEPACPICNYSLSGVPPEVRTTCYGLQVMLIYLRTHQYMSITVSMANQLLYLTK